MPGAMSEALLQAQNGGGSSPGTFTAGSLSDGAAARPGIPSAGSGFAESLHQHGQSGHMEGPEPRPPSPQDRIAHGGVSASALRKERVYTEFRLPAQIMPPDWDGGEEDLVFGIRELGYEDEEQSMELLGADMKFGLVMRHQILLSIYVIGSDYANYDRAKRWMGRIGSRARKVVEMAFNHVNAFDADLGKSVIDGAALRRA